MKSLQSDRYAVGGQSISSILRIAKSPLEWLAKTDLPIMDEILVVRGHDERLLRTEIAHAIAAVIVRFLINRRGDFRRRIGRRSPLQETRPIRFATRSALISTLGMPSSPGDHAVSGAEEIASPRSDPVSALETSAERVTLGTLFRISNCLRWMSATGTPRSSVANAPPRPSIDPRQRSLRPTEPLRSSRPVAGGVLHFKP